MGQSRISTLVPLPTPAGGSFEEPGKASAVSQIALVNRLGTPTWSEAHRLESIAKQGYQLQVFVYRCVRKLVDGVKGIPYYLTNLAGDEIERHPLLDLLHRPNPLQGYAEMCDALVSYLLLAGDTYLEGIAPRSGPPKELWVPRPDRIRTVVNGRGFPSAYRYTNGGQTHDWPIDPITGVSPIMHLLDFNPLGDFHGQPRLMAAFRDTDVANEALRWVKALLENDCRPSGALVVDPKTGPATLGDREYNRLKGEIETQYQGAPNAGRPMLLEGGLRWEPFGYNPAQMEFVKLKLEAARGICEAYGVPGMLVGIPGEATFANMAEAREMMWQDTIVPIVHQLFGGLNRWLVPQFGKDLILVPNLDETPALAGVRAKIWERVDKATFLTLNEKREAVGYEEIEGGDELLVPASMLPLGDATAAELNASPDVSQEDLQKILRASGLSEVRAAQLAKMAYAAAAA